MEESFGRPGRDLVWQSIKLHISQIRHGRANAFEKCNGSSDSVQFNALIAAKIGQRFTSYLRRDTKDWERQYASAEVFFRTGIIDCDRSKLMEDAVIVYDNAEFGWKPKKVRTWGIDINFRLRDSLEREAENMIAVLQLSVGVLSL